MKLLYIRVLLLLVAGEQNGTMEILAAIATHLHTTVEVGTCYSSLWMQENCSHTPRRVLPCLTLSCLLVNCSGETAARSHMHKVVVASAIEHADIILASLHVAWQLCKAGQYAEALRALQPLLHGSTSSQPHTLTHPHITSAARLMAGACYFHMVSLRHASMA